MTRSATLLGLCITGLLSGCGDKDEDGTGGYSDSPILILDAVASCDPTASVWDDLFIFEVETISGVNNVTAEVYVGASWTGSVRLNERGSGNWYAEEEADDLDSDCDEFRSMFFELNATSGLDTHSVEINP